MISIDHQSSIASSERAIGQPSCSKLVHFTMVVYRRSLFDPFLHGPCLKTVDKSQKFV